MILCPLRPFGRGETEPRPSPGHFRLCRRRRSVQLWSYLVKREKKKKIQRRRRRLLRPRIGRTGRGCKRDGGGGVLGGNPERSEKRRRKKESLENSFGQKIFLALLVEVLQKKKSVGLGPFPPFHTGGTGCITLVCCSRNFFPQRSEEKTEWEESLESLGGKGRKKKAFSLKRNRGVVSCAYCVSPFSLTLRSTDGGRKEEAVQ